MTHTNKHTCNDHCMFKATALYEGPPPSLAPNSTNIGSATTLYVRTVGVYTHTVHTTYYTHSMCIYYTYNTYYTYSTVCVYYTIHTYILYIQHVHLQYICTYIHTIRTVCVYTIHTTHIIRTVCVRYMSQVT